MYIFFLLLLSCIPSVTHAMMHQIDKTDIPIEITQSNPSIFGEDITTEIIESDRSTLEKNIPTENKPLSIDFNYQKFPEYKGVHDTSIKEIEWGNENTYYAITEHHNLLKGHVEREKITFAYTGIKNVTHLGPIIKTHFKNPNIDENVSSYIPIVEKNFLNNAVSLVKENQKTRAQGKKYTISQNLYTHNTPISNIYIEQSKPNGYKTFCITGSTYPSIVIYKDLLTKKGESKYERKEGPQKNSFPGYFLIAAQDHHVLYGSILSEEDRKSKVKRWLKSKFTRTSNKGSIYKAKIDQDLNAVENRIMFGKNNVSIDYTTLRPGAISKNYALFFNRKNIPSIYYGADNLLTIENLNEQFRNMVGKPYIVTYEDKKYIIWITSDNKVYSILLKEIAQVHITEHKNIANENEMNTVTQTYDKKRECLYIVTRSKKKNPQNEYEQNLHILPLATLLGIAKE